MRGEPVQSPAPQVSRIRTFLFCALAVVWFTEMVFLGFEPFSKVWAYLWQVTPPQDPQLAAALSITWAVAAPTKGAFFVMALFGLSSKSPSVRTALFVSMALVPPLNIAFPFRQQGFLLGPVAVATVLSTILWGSFLLFKESVEQSPQLTLQKSKRTPPSWWDIFELAWFAIYSAVLTLLALVLLFWPRPAVTFILPCLSSGLESLDLSGPIHSTLASGTHLLAMATACWIATLYCRANPALRRAVAVASTVHAGLFSVFPLRQIILEFGGSCAASSVLAAFVPLFVCWLLYLIIDTLRARVSGARRTRSYVPTSP